MTPFSEIVQAHAARYPAMTPQDYAKLAYQSEFGPEHMVSSRERVCAGLAAETSAPGADWRSEDIGGGLCRFHLGAARSPLSDALLAELFCRTAAEHTGTPEGLAEKLAVLERLDVPGMANFLADYRRRGCPPVHHSEAFRAAYQPHYRLLRVAYARYFPALRRAAELSAAGHPAVISIDGRCGSGKTGLADLMGQLLPCRVVHMDDFYLPMAERAADWMSQPAGNMDLTRFEREVLRPAQRGETIVTRPFDCQTGSLGAAMTLPPRPLTVVEGSYSQHPLLRDAYALTIFVTCPPDEQLRRLERREGAGVQGFRERWIPMEERYHRYAGLPEQSMMQVDTAGLFDA